MRSPWQPISVLSFGKKGSAAGMLSKPCVAAVNELDDETVVTDKGNNRVQLFTSDGT